MFHKYSLPHTCVASPIILVMLAFFYDVFQEFIVLHFTFRSVIYFFFNLFIIYFQLCWVFVSVRGLSLVVVSGSHSSSWCAGLSLSQPLLLWSTGSRRAGSVIVAHGPSCSTACGIFPDQGLNPCPLHRQADSQPLCHQGSPVIYFLKQISLCYICVIFKIIPKFKYRILHLFLSNF